MSKLTESFKTLGKFWPRFKDKILQRKDIENLYKTQKVIQFQQYQQIAIYSIHDHFLQVFLIITLFINILAKTIKCKEIKSKHFLKTVSLIMFKQKPY